MLLLTGAEAGRAATRLDAPTKMLTRGTDRVAVLTAVERVSDSRVMFETVETFYGDSDKRIEVRLDPDTHRDVELGTTYVVAFSNVRRNPRFREIREIDPEGFRVVGVLGGGPALFEDQPFVRLLFTSEVASTPPPPADRLQATLSTMKSRDQRTRTLGILELNLRPEWYSLMDSRATKGLRRLLRQDDLATDLRYYVLDTARRLPGPTRPRWLAKEARRILAGIEPQMDLTTFVPRLAITAIEVLETGGRRSDARRLAPFLGADNPAVVRAALLAVDRYRPDLARLQATALLESDDLHSESRRALAAYVASGDLQ